MRLLGGSGVKVKFLFFFYDGFYFAEVLVLIIFHLILFQLRFVIKNLIAAYAGFHFHCIFYVSTGDFVFVNTICRNIDYTRC